MGPQAKTEDVVVVRMAMSNSIRRVFVSSSCHKLSLVSSLHSHCHYIPSPTSSISSSNPITRPGPTFVFQLSRGRGFANTQSKPPSVLRIRQLSSDNDEGRGTFRGVDFGNAVKSVALSQMEAALEALQRDLAKLSTGIADHIFLVIKGDKIPLNKMAAISCCYSKYCPIFLSITPYDPKTIKKLEKAIVASRFGMSVRVNGEELKAYLPPLTVKQKKALRKLVIKSCEHVRHSIRRVRQKALETMKKAMPKKKEKDKTYFSIPDFSAHDVKKLEKEVDEMTKKYFKSIEEICNAKLLEIVESV